MKVDLPKRSRERDDLEPGSKRLLHQNDEHSTSIHQFISLQKYGGRSRKVLTAIDENVSTLKYTSCQKSFNSHLTRFHAVLHKEKDRKGILELVSFCTWKTSKYAEYLRVDI